MYHIQYLDKKTIDYFNHKLDRCIKDKYRYSENRVQTVNGFQTPNISNDVSIKIKKQLLKNIFKPSDISHLHLIRYNKGGRQELHTHSNEVYSFILYLNDSDGDTVFLFEDRTIFEKPKKGKIIFFNAKIPHKAKISYKNKRVLVGALKPVV
jgi:hypothetical protein|tara:strand:+ start:2102 stop:2557 length:456 start_codon:yes stop_codon:yes gene_type:complete